MKKGILAAVILAFALAVVAPAFADDTPQDMPAAKPALRTELVHLKYYLSHTMMGFINTYLSRDGRVSQGPGNKILVVSDYPENIERVLQAIRQIDVKPADLQFTVQLVLGGETGEPGKESMTNDPIIEELKNLLKYRAYTLLDASLVRAMDNADSEVRMGDKAEFQFWIRPTVIKDEKSSLIQLEVRLRQIHVIVPANATKADYVTTDLIGTTLNIKPGDKTVVGVSKLDGGGKGLILIISGKIVD
jgi:hypothetical protein